MIERADTKTRILDEAEKLFALSGFDSVSLRDITAAAGVNLAAVNYHFQSKDSLIDAAIARRVEPVNATRLALLQQAGPHPTVEQILRAFLTPVFDPSLRQLLPLIGRVHSNPPLFIERVLKRFMAPVGALFVEALGTALPHLSRPELLWRFQFAIGSMSHTLLWSEVIPQITGGLCDFSDREAVTERLVLFLAAAMRAPSSNAASS